MGTTVSLLLSDTFASPARVRAWALERHPGWNWIFLSEDYISLKRWKNGLGGAFDYLQISHELALSAKRLKKPYMQWIAGLGHNHPEPAWWASRISEKNTAVSQVFENICRLDVARGVIEKSDRPVLVLSDSYALLSTLECADWLGAIPCFWPVCGRIPARPTINLIKNILVNSGLALPVLFFVRLVLLLRQLVSAIFAGGSPLPVGNRNVILLHTYLDESSFSPDHEFHDRYFPGLAPILERSGYTVLVLPVMFSIRRSLRSAWCWTASSTTSFLNPYKIYRLSDYVFALRVACRATKLPSGTLTFEGNDLGRIFRSEGAWTSFDVLSQMLYLRLPLRLSQAGVSCLALIAEFENMIPEKMLIHGFRKYQPGAELIGFQHGALYPNLLCNFTPIEERDIAPMYDRVVCNGEFFRDILVSEGLPEERAVVGAALRYRHLHGKYIAPSSGSTTGAMDILVPLPLMLPVGVELLDRLLSAFGEHPEFRVMLKPHPMSSMEDLLRTSGMPLLPSHFEITGDALGSMLPHARLVVGLSTSSMFEAVAAGVPVLRVRRETALDLDPLEFWGDVFPIASSADELLHEARRLLDLSDAERNDLCLRGREILSVSFHPCDEAGFKSFFPARKPQ